MDPLFPELPEDLSALSDADLQSLLEEHEAALEKVKSKDPDYLGDLGADEIVSQTETGVEQMKAIKAEQQAREEAAEAFEARIAELAAEVSPEEEEEENADESESDGEEGEVVVKAEGEELAAEESDRDSDGGEGEKEEDIEGDGKVEAETAVAVVATAEKQKTAEQPQQRQMPARIYRRPPAPSPERQGVEGKVGTSLVAAAGVDGVSAGTELDSTALAVAMIENIKRRSKPVKHAGGVEERTLIATAHYDFPPERILRPNDPEGNTQKLRGIGNPFLGPQALQALTASGGLCAPLTPLYDIPDFAVTDRPVRDALPSFQAERGGVSVPSVSTIGSINTAISVIEEDEDALGGTYATKSCQDMDCPAWTDTAVGIISHCREYGNLNARAWPEGIAHENNLTMAAHARTAEQRLLDRIKVLSINVTTPDVYSSTHDLIYAITRAAAGIRFRLRLGAGAPALRALLPAWVPGMLVADIAATQFDRFKSQAQAVAILRAAGIEPAFYLDDIGSGVSQGFAAETASALDDFPDVIQWAVYVEGEFLHLDGGVLELGIVRDSSLNSTNDYQVFGETFENVARIGPAQGALWVSSTVCPSGEFPSLTTALAC